MLKKPYKLIGTIDKNNYYLLLVGTEFYLTIETVLRYGRKSKRELIVALKQLPLPSVILQLFAQTLKLQPTGEFGEGEGLETETHYKLLDVGQIRRTMGKITPEINPNSPFDYKKGTHNEALKLFIKEGNYLIAVERGGVYSRTIWLGKTDMFSNLVIYQCLMFGKPETECVIDMNMFVLSRDIMRNVLEEITSSIKVEEKQE